MIYLLLSLIAPSIFFILKIANIGVRFSDTNVYFYTAYELLKGKLLYKNIFFTNFPIFPYVSSIYLFVSNNSYIFYYFTPILEIIIISLILFYYSLKKKNNVFIAISTQVLFLFSFIILATSDHQTGVFLASLFSIIAFVFYKNKNKFISGIFLGLMLLTKAYYLPIVITFFIYELLSQKKEFIPMMFGFILTVVLTLSPLVIVGYKEFINDVFIYSLFRSAGIDKIQMIVFFIKHDILFAIIILGMFFLIKKKTFYGVLVLTSLLFIFLYKDVYYLYLNFLIPFIILFLVDSFSYQLQHKKIWVILIITIVTVINIIVYENNFSKLQKIDNISEVVSIVKKEKPQYIYGTMEVVPIISYLSNVPLLNNIIDTNDNLFRSGILDAAQLTNDIFKHNTLVITKGMNYKNENIQNPISGESIDKDQILKFCKKIYTFPIQSEGLINEINIFRCY